MDLRFAALGSVRAWRGQRELDLGPPQQRALTALLVVRAGEPVSVAEIVDVLWRADPPATAVNVVHRHVGQLRRLLEPDLAVRAPGAVLVRAGGGYRLDVSADAVDLLRFRARRAAARSATDVGADELLGQALDEWRGACAAGVDDDARAHPVFVAVDREYAVAVRDAADVALRVGTAGRLLPRLREATGRFPLDEALQARLIRTLGAAGHQAEALAAYRMVRTMLDDELGIDPGPELRAAHEAVLRQQDGAGHAARSTTHSAETTEPSDPHRQPAEPRAAQQWPPPAQLPPAPSMFTGRQSELDRALALHGCAGGPGPLIAAITGTAGIGKTSLALRWAHEVADRFPDGQLYMNLRGFSPTSEVLKPGDALHGFLSAMDVATGRIPTDLQARSALYRSLLTGRRMLVVLDNARDAEQVRPLLPGAPGCCVIVTSRNELTGLIAADGAHPFVLELLPATQARALLTRRLGAARVDAEPNAVDQMIALCAGLPLALAVVAARATTRPGLTLAAIADELQDAHGRLDVLAGSDPATSIRATFSWSLAAVSDPAAAMFRLLGLHPGTDISLAAAVSLAGQSPGEVRRLLGELSAAHLITEQARGRYTFHDLLRAYAAELAQDNPVAADARLRMLDHYLHTAFAGDRLLSPEREPIELDPAAAGVGLEPLADARAAAAWFRREADTLLAGVEIAASAGMDAHTWRLVWSVNTHLRLYGEPRTLLHLQEVSHAAAARIGGPQMVARSHNGLAQAYAALGRFDQAHLHVATARRLFADLGDLPGQGVTAHVTGSLLVRQGLPAEALEAFQLSATLYEQAGNPGAVAGAFNAIGWTRIAQGQYTQALADCEHALELHRAVGDTRSNDGFILHSIGYAHTHLGQHAEAARFYQEACDEFATAGDQHFLAPTLDHLGDARAAVGNVGAAVHAWKQAIAVFADMRQQEPVKALEAKIAAAGSEA